MNTNLHPFALAAVMSGPIVLGASARAEFVGLSCDQFVGEGWIENGYVGLTTYRLYAEFDRCCDDGVLSVLGLDGLPMTMSSSNGQFHNAPGKLDSLTAPEDLRGKGIWENQWDTYVTINATDAFGDATRTGPDSFATDTNNLATDWSTENGGWFVTPADDQRRHVDGRVLLGQFTVASGVEISGLLNLLFDATGGAGRLAIDICEPACPEDLDDSGDIGLGDILAILSAWGNKDGPEDLDHSGLVDFGDLLLILTAWGPCE